VTSCPSRSKASLRLPTEDTPKSPEASGRRSDCFQHAASHRLRSPRFNVHCNGLQPCTYRSCNRSSATAATDRPVSWHPGTNPGLFLTMAATNVDAPGAPSGHHTPERFNETQGELPSRLRPVYRRLQPAQHRQIQRPLSGLPIWLSPLDGCFITIAFYRAILLVLKLLSVERASVAVDSNAVVVRFHRYFELSDLL